jgi:hypothetical protein
VAAAAAAAIALLCGPVSSRAATPGECVVHSSPSSVAQGTGANASSVADVVEVACFQEAGQPVTLEDAQLYARCGNRLNWGQPVPYTTASGPSFNLTLDSFGNATAVLWSSGCAGSQTQLSATLDVAPHTTAATTFTVLPSSQTAPGVRALPSNQVEGAEFSFATVLEAEFSNGAGKRIEVSASNLFHRCKTKPHLRWIYQGKERAGGKAVRLTLDNNGNAFAIILGGPSCTVGESLILAELIQPPYTQYTTSFTDEPPREVL